MIQYYRSGMPFLAWGATHVQLDCKCVVTKFSAFSSLFNSMKTNDC
jgi:hypothetical protein